MNLQLLIGLILTILPISELRVGLPVIVQYCLKNNLNILPYFILVIILNILVIFVIFFFFDFLHNHLMKFKLYKKLIGSFIARTQKKTAKVEENMKNLGFIALFLFVAVPLPGTGAWSGTFISWLLGLNRLKSFIAISLGVILAGLLILIGSLGIFSLF